jgi:hypothetical protein
MLNDAARRFLTVSDTPKKSARGEIIRMIRQNRPLWRIGKDMFDAMRAFR